MLILILIVLILILIVVAIVVIIAILLSRFSWDDLRPFNSSGKYSSIGHTWHATKQRISHAAELSASWVDLCRHRQCGTDYTESEPDHSTWSSTVSVCRPWSYMCKRQVWRETETWKMGHSMRSSTQGCGCALRGWTSCHLAYAKATWTGRAIVSIWMILEMSQNAPCDPNCFETKEDEDFNTLAWFLLHCLGSERNVTHVHKQS